MDCGARAQPTHTSVHPYDRLYDGHVRYQVASWALRARRRPRRAAGGAVRSVRASERAAAGRARGIYIAPRARAWVIAGAVRCRRPSAHPTMNSSWLV